MPPELRTKMLKAAKQAAESSPSSWPKIHEYKNSDTGKFYKPHHADELAFVTNNEYKYLLAKGGEGGGKSVSGIIKDLEYCKHGCSGIVASPDLPHFKRSLWPEFRRWCPWEFVVDRHQYMQPFDWSPTSNFTLAFTTGAVLYMGGADESDPKAQEGPNVTFAHYDEARRHKTPNIFKTFDGRVRIPCGELKPQLYVTTSPAMHWLYDYFGPVQEKDPLSSFKARSLVISLLTRDNIDNLDPGFVEDRRSVLTEAESRVLLDAEWEDIEDADHFLPSMALWDALKTDLPPLTKREPMVLALDAGINSDLFGMIGTTRHPAKHDECAVRFVMKWESRGGKDIDFDGTDDEPGPLKVLKMLRESYNIVMVTYDPYEMRYAASRIRKDAPLWLKEFTQQGKREQADRFLYDLILQKRIWHDGDADLREHIKNADRKLSGDDRKMRLVKRLDSLKIDLAVSLSMSAYEIMRLNV
jgi:hypothetical protein